MSLIFLLIGSGLLILYPTAPMVDGTQLRSDQVFPFFIRHELPGPVAGLVIGAILAAGMSTVDSSLNSCSTVLLTDFAKRKWPQLTSRGEIVLLRCGTILTGLIGTAAAVAVYLRYASGARGVMDIWWQYAGTAGGGMFGLFLVAWLAPALAHGGRPWYCRHVPTARLGNVSTKPRSNGLVLRFPMSTTPEPNRHHGDHRHGRNRRAAQQTHRQRPDPPDNLPMGDPTTDHRN